MPSKKLKITLTRSIIGLSPSRRRPSSRWACGGCASQVTHDDTPTIRGMIAKAPHVLTVTHEA